VASSEERVGKFLKRLLENRSALEVAQSLSSSPPKHASRIPGGGSVSLSAINKRWDLIPHSEEARCALLPESAESEVAFYQNHIENCLGAVEIPVGIAGPLRVRGIFAAGDYYVPLATTEAALVASYSRGAQVITEAGGCRRCIHALMFEDNISLNISRHYANVMRKYTLYSKDLTR